MAGPPLTPERARRWVKYADSSPLYQQLTHVIADDDELLSVLNAVDNPPRHNVLLAGVQFLMMKEGGGELAAFYPNFVTEPRPVSGIAMPFKAFVMSHVEDLVEIGRTRYTQTNECRRCVALLPGIWATTESRFHLVDFGTSAGLNLQVDRYRYQWGEIGWGPDSPVVLITESRGHDVQPRNIEVLSRTGLDLNPIHVDNDDDRMWLEALIWPEHHDRRDRLRGALELALADPPQLIAGDAFETLAQTLTDLPSDDPVVVVNSFILNQFKSEERERLSEIVVRARTDRAVSRVSLEWLDPDADAAYLEVDVGSGLRQIGTAQPHGEWIELYARP